MLFNKQCVFSFSKNNIIQLECILYHELIKVGKYLFELKKK